MKSTSNEIKQRVVKVLLWYIALYSLTIVQKILIITLNLYIMTIDDPNELTMFKIRSQIAMAFFNFVGFGLFSFRFAEPYVRKNAIADIVKFLGLQKRFPVRKIDYSENTTAQSLSHAMNIEYVYLCLFGI